MSQERLDKILVGQGYGSRTEMAEAIRRGRVRVDGTVCLKPETRCDPAAERIVLDGEVIDYRKYMYIMLNKPEGCISATEDGKQRTVMELLPLRFRRMGIFPVGRLDKDSTGLLILTNDGAFCHAVTAPRREVVKRYYVTLDRPIPADAAAAFEEGVVIDGRERCAPARLVPDEPSTAAHVYITEGRYHQVKRMFGAVGCTVLTLERLAIGGVELDVSLARGEWRELTEDELSAFT